MSPVKPTPITKPSGKGFGIKISLNTARPQPATLPPVSRPKPVTAIFNAESSDEEEEIPAEARYKYSSNTISWPYLMVRLFAE